jgi:hypothetical protein
MVHPSIIEARLGELKFRASRWFRAEIHELQHILMDHEKIIALACGRYFGSFALLVATDQRLLLIDKRVFFMNLEDTRYDMISEIDFNSQVYSATVTIHTINKTHKFTSIKNRAQLRDLTNYVQRRVMEFRNQQSALMEGSAVPMAHTLSSPPLAHSRPIPQPMPEPTPVAPPLGTSYNYSPVTPDDNTASPTGGQSPEVAQLVGSAAMQATHRIPFHPYIQGSLMTRRPIGRSSVQTEY